jgi:hypothetical protein
MLIKDNIYVLTTVPPCDINNCIVCKNLVAVNLNLQNQKSQLYDKIYNSEKASR